LLKSIISFLKQLKNELRSVKSNKNSPKSICLAIEKFYNMSKEDKNLMIKKAGDFAIKNFNIINIVKSYETILNN
tara:strand:- start:27 stop:251 length:225 start_codon:yes stop_codon:yes gene_type:complete